MIKGNAEYVSNNIFEIIIHCKLLKNRSRYSYTSVKFSIIVDNLFKSAYLVYEILKKEA